MSKTGAEEFNSEVPAVE